MCFSDLCVFFLNLFRYLVLFGNFGGSFIVGNLEWISFCNWYEFYCVINM